MLYFNRLLVLGLAVVGAISFGGIPGINGALQNKPIAETIPGEYIVVLKDSPAGGPQTKAADIAQAYGVTPIHTYGSVFKGFAATIPSSKIETLKQDPQVLMVSQNRKVHAMATSTGQLVPGGIERVRANTSSLRGTGINVAVVDTGIDSGHPDLAGAVVGGKDCVYGNNYSDGHGHGTHVAGTIAARNNDIGVVGVAPEATLWAVRVLDENGSGSWDGVICGIDFVTSKAPANGGSITVANMSLGGYGEGDNNCGLTNSDALHQAMCRSRDAGVTYVVAAGNSGDDAKYYVPASYDDAVITVSALADSDGKPSSLGPLTNYGVDDTFAYFSNYGSIVDIGAPGATILSTWPGDSYLSISGTSMATPHVAGAAALYMQAHPGSTWKQVRDALVSAGEALGSGHTDPVRLHSEPVLRVPQ